jgi:hypothetical protein
MTPPPTHAPFFAWRLGLAHDSPRHPPRPEPAPFFAWRLGLAHISPRHDSPRHPPRFPWRLRACPNPGLVFDRKMLLRRCAR